MFCRKKGKLLRRGIAAFLLLVIMGSSGAFAVDNSGESAAAEGSGAVTALPDGAEDQQSRESVDEVRETAEEEPAAEEPEFEDVGTVRMEASGSEAEEALEEISEGNAAVVFSQVVPTSKKVRLYYNKTVKYESYRTHDFHVKCDGKDLIAYCIEPARGLKGKRNFTAKPYNSALMTKALYYSYGQPGYNVKTAAYLKGVSRKACYKGNEGIYALCHVMLSYVYDGESDKGDAFKGCSSRTKKVVKNFLAAIKKWPDPPGEPQLGLSSGRVKARWNEETMEQETEDIEVLGTEGNGISVPVPEGAAVVKDGEKISAGSVKVSTGEKFHLTAPVETVGEYTSPAMTGVLKGFQPYIIRNSGTQDQLFSVSTVYSISYSVDWIDFGRVELVKKSSDESVTSGSTYYSLENAVYELRSPESGKVYGTLNTDSSGVASIDNIPYGEYVLKEIKAPEGYELDESEHPVTVSAESQTVTVMEKPRVPDIVTYAAQKETGDKSPVAEGTIVITDMVKYSGVEPGKSYRITGRLMDKSTGEEVQGTAGEMEFTADEASGTLEMEYSLDTAAMAGKTVVAFEKLYCGDEVIAVHEDIENADQSVSFRTPVDSSPEMGDGGGLLLPGIAMTLACAAAGVILIGKRRRTGN